MNPEAEFHVAQKAAVLCAHLQHDDTDLDHHASARHNWAVRKRNSDIVYNGDSPSSGDSNYSSLIILRFVDEIRILPHARHQLG